MKGNGSLPHLKVTERIHSHCRREGLVPRNTAQ